MPVVLASENLSDKSACILQRHTHTLILTHTQFALCPKCYTKASHPGQAMEAVGVITGAALYAKHVARQPVGSPESACACACVRICVCARPIDFCCAAIVWSGSTKGETQQRPTTSRPQALTLTLPTTHLHAANAEKQL